MKVNESIFRDYDIRGLVGSDLSEDFAYVFGKAYGTFLHGKGVKQALVGFDARESSPKYTDSCVKGLLETGVNVILVGMVTSPMIYWARKYYNIGGAVAITASHNPPEYNGFKPCFRNGAMFGDGLQDLKRLMMSEKFTQGSGKLSEKNIKPEYIADITKRIKLDRKLKVVIDCSNAVGSIVAPELFRGLGVEVEELFCDIDPRFPNHPPDPVDARAYPQIVEKIKSGNYDCGFVFDGDADRIGAVDELGNVIRGDIITAICARKIVTDKPGSLIDFELQSSKSATDDVIAHGGKIKLIRVGHSYIEEALVNDKAQLAGETSGHIFFADRWYGFDDALYAGARFLEALSVSGQKLSEIVTSMPAYVSTPSTRVHAPDDKKFKIIDDIKISLKRHPELVSGSIKLLTIDGIRLEWSDGWAVIRASNTQPQLTMRAEAKTEKRLSEIKKFVENALAPYSKDGVVVQWGKVH